jgi:hypothetical protein
MNYKIICSIAPLLTCFIVEASAVGVEYFDVTGSTLASISTPTGYWGKTLYSGSVICDYTIDPAASDGNGEFCATTNVDDGTASISIFVDTYLYPSWSAPCPVEQTAWDNYVTNQVIPHEQQHGADLNAYASGSLSPSVGKTISEIESLIDAVVESATDDTAYGAETQSHSLAHILVETYNSSDLSTALSYIISDNHVAHGTPQPPTGVNCP